MARLHTNFWLFQLIGALNDLEYLYKNIVQAEDDELTLDAQDLKSKLSKKFRENGWVIRGKFYYRWRKAERRKKAQKVAILTLLVIGNVGLEIIGAILRNGVALLIGIGFFVAVVWYLPTVSETTVTINEGYLVRLRRPCCELWIRTLGLFLGRWGILLHLHWGGFDKIFGIAFTGSRCAWVIDPVIVSDKPISNT